MGAGGDFLAGLLTGAFTGVQEGNRIKLAKEENDLRKQQIASTEKLSLAQLSETSRANQANEAIRSRQADIEEQLGLGNLGLGYAGLASHKEIAGMEIGSAEKRQRQSELAASLMQAREHAARSGDMILANSLQKEIINLNHQLGEQSAEAGVGRNIRQAAGIAQATLPVEKEMASYRQNLAKELATFTGEDRLGKIETATNSAMWDLAGVLTGHSLAVDTFGKELLPKMKATVLESIAARGGNADDIAKALAAIKQAANDINVGDTGRSLSAQKALAPFMQAVNNPQATPEQKRQALQDFVGNYFSESQPTGDGGNETGKTAPINLTAPKGSFESWYQSYLKTNGGSVPDQQPYRIAVGSFGAIDRDAAERTITRYLKPGMDEAIARASGFAMGSPAAYSWVAQQLNSDEGMKIRGPMWYRIAKVVEMKGNQGYLIPPPPKQPQPQEPATSKPITAIPPSKYDEDTGPWGGARIGERRKYGA